MIVYTRVSTAVLAVVCFGGLATGGQTRPAAPSAKARSNIVTIGDEDNGKDVDLTSGGTLVVKLKSNASTGYGWAVAGDPSPLKLEKTSYRKDSSSGAMGRPGVQILQFHAGGPGLTTLTINYRRPWEYNAPPARIFHVKVYVR
jgi:inhibitor of cysteine peptidase